jgi:hypothetical protein
VVALVFLNLFIAIILQGFKSTNLRENLKIKDDSLQDFVHKWSKYDPFATGFIEIQDFRKLIEELDPPFKIDENMDYDEKIKFIDSLQLATFDSISKYNFYDVLSNMTKQVILQDKLASTAKNFDLIAREERMNKLIQELDFENNREGIEAIIELQTKSLRLQKKIFKNRDAFPASMLKATMIFKRKLKRIRDRKEFESSLKVRPKMEVHKEALSILKENSDESSSFNSVDSDSEEEFKGWRERELSAKSPSIMIKLPTKSKKTMNQNKIKIFDEEASLSIIEENSHLYSRQSRYSKNELSSNSSIAITRKKRSHKSNSKRSKATRSNKTSSKNKNTWEVDTPSNTHKILDQDTLQLAEEIIEQQSARKTMVNPQVPNSSRNNIPTTSVNLNSSISSRLDTSPQVVAQDVIPAQFCSQNLRNLGLKNLLVKDNIREIMGNS